MIPKLSSFHSRLLARRLCATDLSLFARASSGIPESTINSPATQGAIELIQEAKKEAEGRKISKVMEGYLERAKEYEKFMEKERAQFEIGKRHLANMMGEDVETFDQDKINQAIEYLFPSGLTSKKSKPKMLPPEETYPPRMEAQFDITGRPFHHLFYTAKPKFYSAMHEASLLLNKFNDQLNAMDRTKMHVLDVNSQVSAGATQWMSLEELEDKLMEKEYALFISTMDRIVQHPLSKPAQSFIDQFRVPLSQNLVIREDPVVIQYDEAGRPFSEAKGKMKTAHCTATVRANGTGKILINGKYDILFFEGPYTKEQVMFPLQYTGLLGKVDVECEIEIHWTRYKVEHLEWLFTKKVPVEKGTTYSAIAKAARLAIARALTAHVDDEMREKMRIGGLLTFDPRHRERKKPGRDGARSRWTWKAR
ncbi:unnamed protein product [Cyprideis torosa]|uniref:Uncharacterized protein n=1 Tax=Cyprideis torosa TaxID=163714 RepID=A0A7R8ZJS3_9CRUS|nr:unnamed protein product [Cyprideis torosa]CAG0880245.1 unnamed protein product [Cyprideis torosa]